MIMQTLLVLLSSISFTHLCGSAGQTATAAQSASSTQATPMPLPPYPVGRGPHSLFFLKDSSRLGVGNLGEKPMTVSVFDIDRTTGKLTEIEGSPFERSKSPVKPSVNDNSSYTAYSANGEWRASNHNDKGQIEIYAIDKNHQKKDNRFHIMMGIKGAVAYSPNNLLFAIATSSTDHMKLPKSETQGEGYYYLQDAVHMNEVYQGWGVITPITGQPLKALRPQLKYQTAHKVLTEPDPQLITQNIVESTFKEYILGAQPETACSAPVQELPDKAALEKEKTDKERASRDLDANKLFQAIKDDEIDFVRTHLTPFTINATDSQYLTPLLAAVKKSEVNIAIVKTILEYEGQAMYANDKAEKATAHLDAVDHVGNTALILALIIHKNNHDLAMALAEKMTPAQRKIRSKKGTTALALAEKYEKETDSKSEKKEYQKLITLLEQK